MAFIFEELDFRPTPIGDLMLRRRQSPQLPGIDIFEVKLGEFFLMSSLFHEAEEQLARLGLAAVHDQPNGLDVVVGGLGLGYTAREALCDKRIRRLVVVEYLPPVIEWHQRCMVPLGKDLTGDPRCQLHQADFFACARDASIGFLPDAPGKPVDAILLDIDHTPDHLLDDSNASFYSEQGLACLKPHLKPHGVFALWADGDADPEFTERLSRVFRAAEGHTIEFENPLSGGISTGAVYIARM
jgi:spermidine synthase